MEYGSDTIVPIASAQVAIPTMAQAPMMPTTMLMSHPDSRSYPIGGSEPSSGCETIYWDSLLVFFFFYNIIKISDTYTKELPPEWCPSKSIHIY